MRTCLLILSFGEPTDAHLETVESYLERIFLRNAGLESLRGEAGRARARELAAARAPSLVEDYRVIGGSPHDAQTRAQAEGLEAVLRARGHDVRAHAGFQFTAPSIADAVRAARDEGADVLVALPLYPIPGPSTTDAALDEVRAALREQDWSVELVSVRGWHEEPAYVALRAARIRSFADAAGLDFDDPDTLLYFSAHGTPLRYLEAGSRYDEHVRAHTRAIAEAMGVERFALGFQNHGNRAIPWTQPDNETLIPTLAARRLVADAVSFVHEQSETLSELDITVRAFAAKLGRELHRVPVPHDAPALLDVLADVVERALAAAR